MPSNRVRLSFLRSRILRGRAKREGQPATSVLGGVEFLVPIFPNLPPTHTANTRSVLGVTGVRGKTTGFLRKTHFPFAEIARAYHGSRKLGIVLFHKSQIGVGLAKMHRRRQHTVVHLLMFLVVSQRTPFELHRKLPVVLRNVKTFGSLHRLCCCHQRRVVKLLRPLLWVDWSVILLLYSFRRTTPSPKKPTRTP